MSDAEKQELATLFKSLQNQDNATRKTAEAQYQQLKLTQPNKLLMTMVSILGDARIELLIRQQVAIFLFRLVMRGSEQDFIFPKCDNKAGIAAEFLRLFKQEQDKVLRKRIGQLITRLAQYVCDKEDPRGHLAPGGWPELLPMVFEMASVSTNPNLESCEAALYMLKDLVPVMMEDIVAAKQQVAVVFQQALEHPSLQLRSTAVLLVLSIVNAGEKKDIKDFLATAPVITQVIQQCVQKQDEDTTKALLQSLIESAENSPDFFKASLANSMEPAKTLESVAKARGQIEDSGVRNLALEWLITYAEARSKWLNKSLPQFSTIVLEVCMQFMLEMDDSDDDTKAWAARMDDEEGEEDQDETYHSGEKTIDRLVSTIGFDVISQPLLTIVTTYLQRNEWQAKHAALTAIKQTIEYVDDVEYVISLGKLVVQNLDHPHPRVRFKALHALGQMSNDQSPHFQEATYKEVFPVLLHKMDDPVDRVAAMAMSAFVSFAEELDSALTNQYTPKFMEKMVQKLQTSNHRGVQEECITSIAVIAGNMEKGFAQYYDGIMPMLKQFIATAKKTEQQRLRGKSFECLSLLGLAVGKEKFLPDAKEAVPEMLKSNAEREADDMQREYIKQALERICQCLKKDFALFVPIVLPNLMRDIRLQEDTRLNGADGTSWTVVVGGGKQITVHQTQWEEIRLGVELLWCMAENMQGAYYPWVKDTADALMPLLSAPDVVQYLCDTGFATWAKLIKSAREGSQEKGQQDNATLGALLQHGMMNGFKLIEDPQMTCETLYKTSHGVTECIKNAGPGILASQDVGGLVMRLFKLIEDSFVRSAAESKTKENEAALPQELKDEENEDVNNEEEEERCRQCFVEMLGAAMEVAPAEFVQQSLQTSAQQMSTWLARGSKGLTLHLASDMLHHLKENSCATWQVFMPEVFASLQGSNKEAAAIAAYVVTCAAPIPAFSEAAPQAFQTIAAIVSGKKPKKNDHYGKVLFDNAVSALLALAINKGELCPPQVTQVQAWNLVLANLPLTYDLDEAKKVHKTISELLQQEHKGLLGPNNENLGRVLAILADLHNMEGLAAKETQDAILNIFKRIPQAMLMQMASSFTEKQQKKIEQMLSS